MEDSLPLVEGNFLLERHQGNGGWTYVTLPELRDDSEKPLSKARVRGWIDQRAIKGQNLMPLGQGRFFLSVNLEIRKAIGKREGDRVDLVLYHDDTPFEIPEELVDCLLMEPRAYQVFNGFSESERKYYVEWVYAAKREETKIKRISIMIDRLLLGKKHYDW